MKLPKLLLTALLSASILTPLALQASPIITDPFENTGGGLFGDITSYQNPNKNLLPKVVYPYLPSSSTLLMSGDARNAPDIGAVEAVVLFMAETFAGNTAGGTQGLIIWKITLAVTFAGMLLSGFLTWKAVSQGKKGPGEALMTFLIKSCICIVMLSFVCANIPPLAIGICNSVTGSVSSWYDGGQSSSAPNDQVDLVTSLYNQKSQAALSAVNAAGLKVVTSLSLQPDEYRTAVAQKITEYLEKVPEDLFESQKTKDIQILQKLWKNGASNEAINSKISELAVGKASAGVRGIMDTAASTLKGMTSDEQIEQYISQEIFKAAQGVDASRFSYAEKAVRMYAYMAFAYIGLSIWGLGISSLIWVMLYSLPEEWQLNGILYSGLKAFFAVILTVILISIYMTASIEMGDMQIESISEQNKGMWEGVSDGIGYWWNNGDGLAGKFTDYVLTGAGSFAAKTMSWFTGMTIQTIIIGMLIFTAPAQAALMVKGGNGIAESAKSALVNSGGGSSGAGAWFGSQGQSSGANMGGGFSMGSIIQNRSDIMGQLAPKSKN